MTVRLRLQRRGTKKRPFYRIVVADQRSPRDGRYIEQLGIYDPLQEPAVVDLDVEKAREWIGKGAQATETVEKLIKKVESGKTQTKEEFEAKNRAARKERQEAAAKGVKIPEKAAPAPEEKAEAADDSSEESAEAAATEEASTEEPAAEAAGDDADSSEEEGDDSDDEKS